MGYELYFEKAPTGRTHQVNNGGVIQNQPILGADGEPETQYELGAIVDGHRVPLETYTIGYVEHMAQRPDTAIDESSSSSSTAAAEQATATQQEAGTSSSASSEQPAAPPAEQPTG